MEACTLLQQEVRINWLKMGKRLEMASRSMFSSTQVPRGGLSSWQESDSDDEVFVWSETDKHLATQLVHNLWV